MKEPKIRFKGFQGEWETTKYEEVFSLIGDTGHNVQKNEYCERGLYPVVDQSKEYIVGYTDKVMPIDGSKGLIIFGDHTREIKYIDFPFCTGADGTRILKSEQSFDVRFMYYVCLSLDIPNTGYNRHFKYIKESIYNIPKTKAEQQSIASYFQHLDSLIQSTTKKIESLKQVKAASLQSMFPQEGETTPRVRFKGFEGEWEECLIKDKVNNITTGKLDANAMVPNGKYRFYTCGKEYFKIDKYAFDDEALLISGNGENVGYIHYYNGKFNAYQRTYVLTSFTLNVFYLEHYLKARLSIRINKEKSVANTPYIKMDTISDMNVLYPNDIAEQRAIASYFTSLDRQITLHTQRLEKLKQIKAACLDKMFV